MGRGRGGARGVARARVWALRSGCLLLLTLLGGVLALPSGAQNALPPGRIAFAGDGDLFVWQNGDITRVLDDENATSPRWSPDGQQLLFVRQADSFSNLLLLTLADGSLGQLTLNEPAYPVGSYEYALNSVWAVDPAWAPSGLIAFASDYYTAGSWLTLWLISDFSLGMGPALAAQDEGHLSDITLSSDGAIAGYTVRATRDDGALWTYTALRDLNDGVAYLLADDPGGSFDPAISPDDQSVAVAIRGDDGVSDIWIIERAGRTRLRVTENANAVSPVWSPDGSWIAYIKMVDFHLELWVAPIGPDGQPGEGFQLARPDALDAPGGLSWTYN